MYQPRDYRHWVKAGELACFDVVVQETDLYICAASDLSREARKLILEARRQIEDYIARQPAFAESLEPLEFAANAPPLVVEMMQAAQKFNVGPMAAVAGAVAQFVGQGLLKYSPEVIVENGGDIFIESNKDRIIAIYAGNSPLSGQIGLEIKAADTPMGVCTSSGTVGHSLSLGKSDAVVALAQSAAVADAAATAIGNIVSSPDDIPTAIEQAKNSSELAGILIIKDHQMGAWGQVRICHLDASREPNL
jgi:ApbE superfamily uncharacterized protein (UPF0280 family)